MQLGRGKTNLVTGLAKARGAGSPALKTEQTFGLELRKMPFRYFARVLNPAVPSPWPLTAIAVHSGE
jgi:hypothetical protein